MCTLALCCKCVVSLQIVLSVWNCCKDVNTVTAGLHQGMANGGSDASLREMQHATFYLACCMVIM
jgi:hypothetical protein